MELVNPDTSTLTLTTGLGVSPVSVMVRRHNVLLQKDIRQLTSSVTLIQVWAI